MDQVAALLTEALRKHYGTQWEKTGNTGHALARSKAAAPYNRCCNHAGKGDPRSPGQKNAFQLPQQDKGKNWGKAGQKANPQGLPVEVGRRSLRESTREKTEGLHKPLSPVMAGEELC